MVRTINAVLLTLTGTQSYRNICALCSPAPITDKSFGELVVLMKNTGITANSRSE